jgi:hypothetical protein
MSTEEPVTSTDSLIASSTEEVATSTEEFATSMNIPVAFSTEEPAVSSTELPVSGPATSTEEITATAFFSNHLGGSFALALFSRGSMQQH